jgi:hypothetical protein
VTMRPQRTGAQTARLPARRDYMLTVAEISTLPHDRMLTSTSQQRRGRGSGGVAGRGFRPGQSGCPGGRPRVARPTGRGIGAGVR